MQPRTIAHLEKVIYFLPEAFTAMKLREKTALTAKEIADLKSPPKKDEKQDPKKAEADYLELSKKIVDFYVFNTPKIFLEILKKQTPGKWKLPLHALELYNAASNSGAINFGAYLSETGLPRFVNDKQLYYKMLWLQWGLFRIFRLFTVGCELHFVPSTAMPVQNSNSSHLYVYKEKNDLFYYFNYKKIKFKNTKCNKIINNLFEKTQSNNNFLLKNIDLNAEEKEIYAALIKESFNNNHTNDNTILDNLEVDLPLIPKTSLYAEIFRIYYNTQQFSQAYETVNQDLGYDTAEFRNAFTIESDEESYRAVLSALTSKPSPPINSRPEAMTTKDEKHSQSPATQVTFSLPAASAPSITPPVAATQTPDEKTPEPKQESPSERKPEETRKSMFQRFFRDDITPEYETNTSEGELAYLRSQMKELQASLAEKEQQEKDFYQNPLLLAKEAVCRYQNYLLKLLELNPKDDGAILKKSGEIRTKLTATQLLIDAKTMDEFRKNYKVIKPKLESNRDTCTAIFLKIIASILTAFIATPFLWRSKGYATTSEVDNILREEQKHRRP